nr:sigma factor-like helix-turn-helix DNA-binding protein [Oscillochloris trichoides]
MAIVLEFSELPVTFGIILRHSQWKGWSKHQQEGASLTSEQQHVLALRYGQEMPIQEVARTLGKTEGAIKQLQARAIAALTRKLTSGMVEW